MAALLRHKKLNKILVYNKHMHKQLNPGTWEIEGSSVQSLTSYTVSAQWAHKNANTLIRKTGMAKKWSPSFSWTGFIKAQK